MLNIIKIIDKILAVILKIFVIPLKLYTAFVNGFLKGTKKMKMLFFVIVSVLFFSCSSSQNLTYRPVNDSALWQIEISKSSGFDGFTVTINDDEVLSEGINWMTKSMDEKTTYKNKEVRLIVNPYSSYIDEGYDVTLLIDNELISKMKF